MDGVICGHIHRAEITEIDGVLYCNDGDWVESCTTLTEDFKGRLSLLRWTETQGSAHAEPARCRCRWRRVDAGRVKIAIVTDAWRPQTNGVVQTLSTTAEKLRAHAATTCCVIEPQSVSDVPCPTYPEIRLALVAVSAASRALLERLRSGCSAHRDRRPARHAPRARWCVRSGMPFTTSYHTQFPEYVRARVADSARQ